MQAQVNSHLINERQKTLPKQLFISRRQYIRNYYSVIEFFDSRCLVKEKSLITTNEIQKVMFSDQVEKVGI